MIIYIFFINIVAIISMAVDKRRACKRRWRVSESRLWGMAILGGALGILLGMKWLRHKTKHRRFVIGIPILCVIQVVFFAGLFLT